MTLAPSRHLSADPGRSQPCAYRDDGHAAAPLPEPVSVAASRDSLPLSTAGSSSLGQFGEAPAVATRSGTADRALCTP